MNIKLGLLFSSILFISSALLATQNDNNATNKCIDLIHTDNSTKNICEKNNKPFLILEFFSARCSHCRANVPNYKKLETLTARVAHSRLISLNPIEEATNFANDNSIETEIAIDGARSAARAFGVNGVPTVFVLNSNNEIVFNHAGRLNDSVINTIVNLVSR